MTKTGKRVLIVGGAVVAAGAVATAVYLISKKQTEDASLNTVQKKPLPYPANKGG